MAKQVTRTARASSIADFSKQQMTTLVAQVNAALDRIDALMADGVTLSDDARASSLRLGANEASALDGVLDYADARPELFTDLADQDAGSDPAVFETGLLRSRLANAVALAGLLARFDEVRLRVSDSSLYVATLAKRPCLAAYELGKGRAKLDKRNGSKLNKAINLYGGIAKAASKTKAKNKAAAGAAKAAANATSGA